MLVHDRDKCVVGGVFDYTPEEVEEHDCFLGHQEQRTASCCQVWGLAWLWKPSKGDDSHFNISELQYGSRLRQRNIEKWF